MHREFGVRDFSGEEAIDDIYEHQRYSYLSFSWGSSLPGHLLLTDRHRWSGLHGSPSSQTREKVEPSLPVNWFWTGDWVIDKTSCKCDVDGWTYAPDFTMINFLIKNGEDRSEPNVTDYVRRRRWIRPRRRVMDPLPSILLPKAASNDKKVESRCSGDGINAKVETIENIIPDKPTNVELPALHGLQQDSPPRIGLEYFSLEMDKIAFDAAWNVAVQDLEHVNIRAKAQRAKKKQKWGVKKDRIKRQIHLLETTIASMQAIALEEEQKRRNKRNLSSESLRNKEANTSSSPSKTSLLTAAAIDSPTNMVILAARIKCAQSKLDALRRFFWHPRENGYSLRFSIDGIYYGLRDFYVESFDSAYSLQISHQTNGARGITPVCKVSMKGHTVCCGKHVKVVGEKGTRVPKSIWDSMYMDTDFDVSINLIYVEDIGKKSEGRWEFLLSPEATNVEFFNFKRRVKGGMDLPEPMVRRLCSDVLSSLVRDLTLLYFPYELATAFQLPPAKLNIQGELKITGQSIDNFMEKELTELDMSAVNQAKHKLREQSSGKGPYRPLSPTREAGLAFAHKLSSLLTGPNKEMQAIAEYFQLSPPQFNLLIAIKNSAFFPSKYTFHSLASVCLYYNTLSVDEEMFEPTKSNDETSSQDERLRAAWKRIVELVFIKNMKACIMSPKKTSRRKFRPSENAQLELFDVDKFFDKIKGLSKKPANIHVTIEHFHLTVNALNVVEALTKLYERIILGIDYSKPRMAADGFIYGIRLGRKAAIHPAMTLATVTAAASAAIHEMHHVGSPPIIGRQHRLTEDSFRARAPSSSTLWQSLKKAIDFVRKNVDDASVELVGNMKGTDEDCVLSGSFKDASFCGPLSVGISVPSCFLGFYRAEMVTLGNDRIGLQVDVMLPSLSADNVTSNFKLQSVKAREYVGRVMVADFSTEVLINLNALIVREEERRKQSMAPTENDVPSCGPLQQPRNSEKLNQHCALSFSFDSAISRNDEDVTPSTKAIGHLNVGTSEVTRLQTKARVGSYTLSLLSVADYLLTHYVKPYVLKAFPQHQLLFSSTKRSIMAFLQSSTFEMEFNIMTRAFINEDRNLMITCCGLPSHPTPATIKKEVNLLDIILQADDLINLWIDDRYPPYANPLHF